MEALTVHIEGIGWHSPGHADWNSAAAALRDGGPLSAAATRPRAAVLPPAERRRAPLAVLLACEAAQQACAMAQREAASLPCVFASMLGDIAITDEMCATLADAPRELSPTRFHNSVHNAPVGYWTVATGCHAASTAVSAWDGSFAAGLLEAAIESAAEARPVLFAAYDIPAPGPLAEVLPRTEPFAVAFVLNAGRDARAFAALRLRHEADAAEAGAADPMAAPLPLLAALARGAAAVLSIPAGADARLAIEVQP